MLFKGSFVLFFQLVHGFEKFTTELTGKDGTVGDVKQLACFRHIHELDQFPVGKRIHIGDLGDVCSDVVEFEHVVEVGKSRLVHLAVESGIVFCDDGHSHQPAGTGGLEMEIAAGFPSHGGIDGKLVAAGVNRDFVVAVSLGDLSMDLELTVKFGKVADVVDSLLELADEAGSQ